MSNYIPDSLASLSQSTALISSLSFTRTNTFTRAVLSSEEWFETHLIRDAEPYELALFRPSTTTAGYDPDVGGAGAGGIGAGPDEWTATKRDGPQRVGGFDKASPLKEKRGGNNSNAENPERCLKAAKRLLDIYPMPRATERVGALSDQYEGLVHALAELDESLKRPLSRSHVHPYHEEHLRAQELEEAIKREQMEIFALEQIQSEKAAELAALNHKPKPRQPPAATVKSASTTTRRPPPINTSTSPSSTNPFAKSTLLDSRRTGTTPTTASTIKSTGSVPSPRSPPSVVSPPRQKYPLRSSPTKSVGGTPSPKRPTTSNKGTPQSRETTPRAAQAQAPLVQPAFASATAATRARMSPKAVEKLGPGVPKEDLDAIAAKVWAGLSDILLPWARKTLAPSAPLSPPLSFTDTAKTLTNIITTPSPSPSEPASPSISSTLASLDPDSDPVAPSPSSLLELQLLNILFTSLSPPSSSSSTPSSIHLPIIMRDTLLSEKKEPMVNMTLLKSLLVKFTEERGWKGGDGMSTSAVYGLVSKTVLRIERRGREGALVGFK